MKESEIEKRCRLYVEELGGDFLKWVSPGNAGVHDRIVLLPFRMTGFVELKTPDGTVAALQNYWTRRFIKMGKPAVVVDNFEDFKRFVDRLPQEGTRKEDYVEVRTAKKRPARSD